MGTALTLRSRPDWRMPRLFPILNWGTDVWTRTRPCSHATDGDAEPRCARDDSANVSVNINGRGNRRSNVGTIQLLGAAHQGTGRAASRFPQLSGLRF